VIAAVFAVATRTTLQALCIFGEQLASVLAPTHKLASVVNLGQLGR
jgi:hypothetical protein